MLYIIHSFKLLDKTHKNLIQKGSMNRLGGWIAIYGVAIVS